MLFTPLSCSKRPALRLTVLVYEITHWLYRTSCIPMFLLTVARLSTNSYQNKSLACSRALSLGRRGLGLIQLQDFYPTQSQIAVDVSSPVSPNVNQIYEHLAIVLKRQVYHRFLHLKPEWTSIQSNHNLHICVTDSVIGLM